MPKSFITSANEYRQQLGDFAAFLIKNKDNLYPGMFAITKDIDNVILMMERLQKWTLKFQNKRLPEFEASYNNMTNVLKKFVSKTSTTKLSGFAKELRDRAAEIISDEVSLPARQVIRAGHMMDEVQAANGTDEMIKEAGKIYDKIGEYGHRPSVEELRTLNGYTTDVDTLVDRLVWMNNWYVNRYMADKKVPDIYEKTVGRIFDELDRCAPDRQAEVMKKMYDYQVYTREMAYAQYRFIQSDPDKSETEKLLELAASPAYRAADAAGHLVFDNAVGRPSMELLTYMSGNGSKNDAFAKRPSAFIFKMQNGGMQEALKKQNPQAIQSWERQDELRAKGFLEGNGYTENDIRSSLLSSYTELMADQRSASTSFQDMQKTMKALLSDEPGYIHKAPADYLNKLDQATEAVQNYLDTHNSPNTKKGKERVANAEKLMLALKELEKDPTVKSLRNEQAALIKEQMKERQNEIQEGQKALENGLVSLQKGELADPQGFLKTTYAHLLYNQLKKDAKAPINKETEEAEFRKFYSDKTVQSIVSKAASEKDLKTIRTAAADKTGKTLSSALGKLKTQITHTTTSSKTRQLGDGGAILR